MNYFSSEHICYCGDSNGAHVHICPQCMGVITNDILIHPTCTMTEEEEVDVLELDHQNYD